MADVDDIQEQEAERQLFIEEIRQAIFDYENKTFSSSRTVSGGIILTLIHFLSSLSQEPVNVGGIVMSAANPHQRFVSEEIIPKVEGFAKTPEEKGIILARLMELSAEDFLRVFITEMGAKDLGLR